ncbi:MAG: S26 family signal peptidase [Clostridia bacterium]|nr:S26 family signal peptidase [Clostridia bacterium]
MDAEKKEAKKEISVPRRIVRIVGTVLVVVLLVLFVVGFISNRVQGKPMFLFGRAWIWVQTGSMENTIPAKSYILIKQPGDAAHLEKGTVITFMCNDTSSEVYGQYVTHRIDEVVEGGYKTKGDNVLSVRDSWTVHPEDILAVYVRNMPILTFIGRLLMSPMGLAIIILAFVLICAFVYIPEIVKALKEPDEKAPQQSMDEDEMKRRIAEEVEKLKQQKAQQDAQGEGSSPAESAGSAEETAAPEDADKTSD